MKSRNVLILALIMALVTTFLFNKYLKDLDNKYKKNQDRVSVVVSKINIRKNQKITKEMLELKELSKDSVHPEAAKKIEEIDGNYALTDIKEGEILFADRFTNQYTEKELVTRKITNGYRAVSIEVNLVESVSNLIQPEDYVDVVFSEKVKDDASKEIVSTQILLENIRVLAVGKRLSEEQPGSNDPNSGGQDQVEYTSVTLELKPEDVVKIVNADERGGIKLTLRSKISP